MTAAIATALPGACSACKTMEVMLRALSAAFVDADDMRLSRLKKGCNITRPADRDAATLANKLGRDFTGRDDADASTQRIRVRSGLPCGLMNFAPAATCDLDFDDSQRSTVGAIHHNICNAFASVNFRFEIQCTSIQIGGDGRLNQSLVLPLDRPPRHFVRLNADAALFAQSNKDLCLSDFLRCQVVEDFADDFSLIHARDSAFGIQPHISSRGDANTQLLQFGGHCDRSDVGRVGRIDRFPWIQIGPQYMTADATHALDVQHAFGWDLWPPLGDRLGGDPTEFCRKLLRSDGGCSQINGVLRVLGLVAHRAPKYTGSLSFVHHGLIAGATPRANNQPMVNNPPGDKPKRPSPATHPRRFKTFAAWLREAVAVRGHQRLLASYCGTTPQSVTKWLDKSEPDLHYLRKIASWAQVEVMDLRRLIDGTFEDPDFDGPRVVDPWPFSIAKSRYDELSDEQKSEIQGAVRRLILEFEDQRGTSKKSRLARP